MRERGVTLVELLTYLSLFSVLCGAVLGAETFARKTNQQDAALLQVIQDADRAFAQLRRDAGTARFFEGPTAENGEAAAVFHLPAFDDRGTPLDASDRAYYRLVPAASGSGGMELWRLVVPAERSARPAWKDLVARDVVRFEVRREPGAGPTLLAASLEIAYLRGKERLFARSYEERMWLRAER